MLTWTTYGTRLQGDERGYVKKAKVLPGDEKPEESNCKSQANETVRLSGEQKEIVRQAIMKQGATLGQKILALAVCSNHIHLVAEYIPKPVGRVVANYKKAGRLGLKKLGLDGRVWTTGYDKRFCFDRVSLDQRIKYVYPSG